VSATCIVAEQRPSVLRSLETDVQRAGLTIVARIARGDDLVESARRLQPDVVIMDVEIHGTVRGWQALMALKESPETTQIPVIAYADLDFPWYVPEDERASLERACLELADAYLHPHRLCFEIVAALEKVGVEVHSLGGASSRE
jgi:DNA-binding NarL/FixJ family response regulator